MLCSAQDDKLFAENTNKQENCKLMQQMIQPIDIGHNPVEEKIESLYFSFKKRGNRRNEPTAV